MTTKCILRANEAEKLQFLFNFSVSSRNRWQQKKCTRPLQFLCIFDLQIEMQRVVILLIFKNNFKKGEKKSCSCESATRWAFLLVPHSPSTINTLLMQFASLPTVSSSSAMLLLQITLQNFTKSTFIAEFCSCEKFLFEKELFISN